MMTKEDISAQADRFMVENASVLAQVADDIVREKIEKWQNGGGWQEDNAKMGKVMEVLNFTAKPVPGKGLRLRLAVPLKTAYMLRDFMFDGMARWDLNPHVVKWLKKQPEMEYLKNQPLADKLPEDM